MSYLVQQAYCQGNQCPTYTLPPLFRNIADEFGVSGVDMAVIAPTIVTFISILTQGLADVQWPNGMPHKSGTPVLVVSPSGGGKSVVFNALKAPLSTYLTKISAVDGSANRPSFFVEDVNREALLKHLTPWPVAALLTDEGGQVKQLFNRGAPAVAKLLDGAALHHARVSTGRVELRDHRFTMLLMMQPNVFESMRTMLSTGNGGVGLSNRFIWAQGRQLPPGASTHAVQLSPKTHLRYSTLVAALLTRTIDNVQNKRTRPALKLSEAATRYLVALPSDIRSRFLTVDTWAPTAEYASRHSERTLSLAGAFHLATGSDSDEVPLHQVEAAAEFDRWSISNHFEMTQVPPKLSQAEQDAYGLGYALTQIAFSTSFSPILLADLRRQAPNFGLTRGRLDRAISVLGERRQIFISLLGGRDYLHVVLPHQPPQQPRLSQIRY